MFAPACGWALQSAVVWAGAHTALAGTATTVGALHLGLTAYDSARIDGMRVPVPALAALVERLGGLTVAERSALPGLDPRRADVIYAGSMILLRVALRAPARGIPLERVIAVCPAIHPHSVLEALERAPWFYHAYFMLKWRGSLKRKASLFPDVYTFDQKFLRQRMRELTAALITRSGEFDSLDAYLDGYSLHGDRLAKLTIPSAILTSQDDPIIPIEDFHALQLPPGVRLDITPHGGHCGFIQDWSLKSYAEDWLLARLDEPVEARATVANAVA